MRALLAALLPLFLTGCGALFFHPDTDMAESPAQFGLDYEPLAIRASDGTRLVAWFIPALGKAQGAVLYLHGTHENISTRIGDIAWLPAAGFSVLALDYRGYGASAGTPTLSGVQLDIDAAMRALLARPDVDPNRVIVFGQSLGAALAVYYVAHSPYRAKLRAVVLDSPFSDYRLIAEEKVSGYLPAWSLKWLARWLIPDQYSPQSVIEDLSPVPVLLLHGDRDLVVPLHHSQRLFNLAGEPKQLWVVPGAGHVQALEKAAIRRRLARFLHACVSGRVMHAGN